MKKILIIISVCSVLLVQCRPYDPPVTPLASVSVTNASPGASAVDVVINGLISNPNRLSFRTTSLSNSSTSLPYLPLEAGERELQITTDTGRTFYFNQKLNFGLGKIYSIFLYDTLQNNQPRYMRLNDDLTLPSDTNMTNVRFLHLAPNASAVDVTVVRIVNQKPNDSATLTNKSYIGASPNVDQLASFTSIPGGDTCIIKVKPAGTQDVLTSMQVIRNDAMNLTKGRIVTMYITGTAKSTPLSLNLFKHY